MTSSQANYRNSRFGLLVVAKNKYGAPCHVISNVIELRGLAATAWMRDNACKRQGAEYAAVLIPESLVSQCS